MIAKLFLEQFWRLLVLLATLELAVVAIWWWRRTQPWARGVWFGLGTSAALLVFSCWTVTPREEVIGLCEDMAAMVESGDVTGIAGYLAAEFEAGGLERHEFLERTRATLTRFHVDHAKLRGFEVEFPQPDRAVAVFNAVCRVRSDAFVTNWLVSRWRVSVQQDGEAWMVRRVEAIPAPFSPIRRVRDCFR